MFNLFTILRLIKEFCELVPEDFDYVKDQLSLYAAMRDYLIEGIESAIPRELGTDLKQYKCTEKLYAFITDFIDADCGKQYKKILSKYLV